MHAIIKSNAIRKVIQLRNFIGKNDRVLDFGCGDLTFAKQLFHAIPTIHISAVDVVDFGIRDPHIVYTQYDGKHLPYKDNFFDSVIIYHVLHHTDNPENMLRECFRVSKKTVLLVEPVYRFHLEIIGMSIMDWIFNAWKNKTISFAFAFRSLKDWKRIIQCEGWTVKKLKDIEILPWWLPTGRSYLFYSVKQKM